MIKRYIKVVSQITQGSDSLHVHEGSPPKSPILLHALLLVLGWISTGNQQSLRPWLPFRGCWLWFKKYRKSERHSLSELHDSTRKPSPSIPCMTPTCPSPSLWWFPYTPGRNSSVWVESSLWTVIASFASLSEEVESLMHTMRTCCTSCGENWFGSKCTTVNWIGNNDVEQT